VLQVVGIRELYRGYGGKNEGDSWGWLRTGGGSQTMSDVL